MSVAGIAKLQPSYFLVLDVFFVFSTKEPGGSIFKLNAFRKGGRGRESWIYEDVHSDEGHHV